MLGEEGADWAALARAEPVLRGDGRGPAVGRHAAWRRCATSRGTACATHVETVPAATVVAALRGAAAVQVVDLSRADLERQARWCDAVLAPTPRTVRGVLAAEHTVARCGAVPRSPRSRASTLRTSNGASSPDATGCRAPSRSPSTRACPSTSTTAPFCAAAGPPSTPRRSRRLPGPWRSLSATVVSSRTSHDRARAADAAGTPPSSTTRSWNRCVNGCSRGRRHHGHRIATAVRETGAGARRGGFGARG
ncbi:hypothetical protein QJS66_18705 [Kocuria rhizophila]|nr:hypothetical protein QJS66_18705 [Kocuria rhizophila]